MTDRPDLTDLLDRAVPDPPSLAGLAARAQADARRARTRRRTAVGAAALVLVAVATSLTVGSRTTPPTASDRVALDPTDAIPCRAGASLEVNSDAEPVSVRFCPDPRQVPGNPMGDALVPTAPLTTDVLRTVSELDETVEAAATSFCVTERSPYVIQIGLADGTVRRLSDQDCGRGLPVLLAAIGRQSAPDAEPSTDPLRCDLRGPNLRGGDASDPPYAPLLTLPAVQAVRCTAYAADVRARSEVEDPEELRADLLSSYVPGMADCAGDPRGVVTTWALRLADGSIHTAHLDGRVCGPLTIDGTYVGLAGAILNARTAQRAD